MIVNLLLTILSILLMLAKVTGVLIHETLAVGFIIAVCIHLLLNRNWFKAGAIRKNLKSKSKKSQFVWNSILTGSTLLLIVSGLARSQVILLTGGSGAVMGVHSIAAKLFIIAAGAHVWMHRQYLKATLHKLTGVNRAKKNAVIAEAD